LIMSRSLLMDLQSMLNTIIAKSKTIMNELKIDRYWIEIVNPAKFRNYQL